MPSVALVRHGQASFGAADYDVLSATGRDQAELLGRELARRGAAPVRVASGRLRRQRDTAAIALAAAGLDVSVAVDGRWDEYDHVALLEHHVDGAPAGAPPEDAARAVQRALDGALRSWTAADECPDCVRHWPRFRAETGAALDELLDAAGSGGSALAVTSGGVIAAVVAGLLGLPADGFLALNRVVANASLTTVVRGRGGTSLVTFNDHAHLLGQDALLTYR